MYNQKFDNRNDIPDENCLKAGDILYKNVPYIISNYKLNKTENQTWLPDKISVYTSDFSGGSGSSMSFVDAKTRKEIDRASFYTSNSVIQTELFLQPKTYIVKSVEYDNGYYRVMLGCAHEDVTTTTEPVLDATCTTKGAYIEIKTCADCGEELSRETKYTNALGHNPGTPAKENEVKATCTNGGSYQEVTRCTRCNEILSSALKTTPATGHKFGEWTAVDTVSQDVIDGAVNKDIFSGQSLPASLEKRTCSVCGAYEIRSVQSHIHSGYVMSKENIIDATCTKEGSYDVVTRCGTCNEEIARMHVVTDKKAHTPGQAVVENEIKATCTADGSYDEVVKCTVCGEELSRTAYTTKALGHVKGTAVKENVVNPACETEGSYNEVIYCERDEDGCSHSKLSSTHVTVPATGHLHQTTRIEKTKEPTCTEKGLYKSVTYCTDCNKVLNTKDIEISATGHTAGEVQKENVKDATCENKGGYDDVTRCTKCNAVISKNAVKTEALGHIAGEPVIENKVDPTTKKEGGYDIVVYCTRDNHGCGHKELSRKHVIIDNLKHEHTAGEPVIEVVKAATCEDNGSVKVTVSCTDCGEVLSSVTKDIPALGHNYEFTKTVDATCTKDGYILYTCKNDASHTKKNIIKASGHDYVHQTDSYSAPTCVKDGKYREYDKCVNCGDITNEKWYKIDATGHSFKDWVEITDRSILTEELFKNAVNSDDFFAKAKTKAKRSIARSVFAGIGEFDKVYRNDCKENDGYMLKVEKHVHSDFTTEKENVVAATCTKEGSFDEVVKCGVCGEEVSRDTITMPMLNHEPGTAVKTVVKEVDCTDKGLIKTVISCKNCGKELVNDETETSALGHIAGEAVIENKIDPTTEKEGGYDVVIYCMRDDHGCGHKELSRKHIVLDKLKPEEHHHTAGIPVIENRKAATCENKGGFDINVYCAECSELLSSTHEDIPALGHNYEFTKTVAATCTKDGYNLYTCKNNASHTKKDVIKASGHKYIHKTDSYTEPTCTESGKYREYDECVNCGDVVNEEWKSVDALGHEAGEPVIENKVDPTTEKEGGYDIVVYCTREHNGCGKSEISRKHIILDKLKHEHTVGKPVVENKINATCTKNGSYDVNVYCTDCNKLLNSTHETTEALGHEYSEPVIENKDGDKYDEVIYCTRCGAELSRRTIDNSKKEPVAPDNKPEVKPETKPETKPEITPETKPEAVNIVTPQDVETKIDDTVTTDNNNNADSTEEKTPVTGDTTDIMMYVYIMIAGAVAVTTAVVMGHNKRKNI